MDAKIALYMLYWICTNNANMEKIRIFNEFFFNIIKTILII